MKCCIGDYNQRSFTLGKMKILYAVEIRFLNNKILMDYTHQTLILPLVELLKLYKYVILLLVEPVFEARNCILFFVKTRKKRNFTGKQVVFKQKNKAP